jgi:hypothetical protein
MLTYKDGYGHLTFNAGSRESIEMAIQLLENNLMNVPQERYADILFPGQPRVWTYHLPTYEREFLHVGSFASVERGVFMGWIGRVVDIHDRKPPCEYVYDCELVR